MSDNTNNISDGHDLNGRPSMFGGDETRAMILDAVGGEAGGSPQRGRTVDLDAGETLLQEGHEADTVYVLLRGGLAVSRRQDGRNLPVATVTESGSVVGEMSLMGNNIRQATVTAAEASRLVELQRHEFDALVNGTPELAGGLGQAAIDRAEQAELAALLSNHFRIDNPETVASLCAEAIWHARGPGKSCFGKGIRPTVSTS